MALSLLGLATHGLHEGIEFKGGSEFRISSVKDTSTLLAQDAVGKARGGGETPLVSVVGSNDIRVQTGTLDLKQVDTVRAELAQAYGVADSQVTSSFVGPSWGKDVSNKAIVSLVVFLVLVSLVIALYFRTWTMAVAAIVALLHDMLLTVGIYALIGFEVTPESVIGFLTILGYSLYDTVVVFDKVRENTEHITSSTRRTYAEAANLAVNQTLVRSINTSVVALLPVGAILFIGALLLGAGTLKDLALALFVGIAAGTYSSIFIATPLLVELRSRQPEMKAQEQRVLKRRRDEKVRAVEPVMAGVGAAEPVLDGGAAPAAVAVEPKRELGQQGAGGQRQQPRRGGGAGRNRPGGRRS